ncbi:unnamed protein product [Cyclocybe aegerita]|uniref:Uncharacterized protein n=1 Tax=Cyclocybe aegerita TaxID=1973307 RepID=A0A8S0W6I0_CYCAE|nr:unnamed protein product [Cyclocybe aegerita]
MADASDSTENESPFPPGVLTEEHEKQMLAIHACLEEWVDTHNDSRKNAEGAKERLKVATEKLANLKIDAPYAYAPAPPYTYRSVLLSCTKTYWVALLAALDDDKKAEIAQRLEMVPPYGKRVPKFKGKRCVQKAAELNEREYEGLMRTAMFVAMGLVPDFVVEWWRELGEVGVMNWEDEPGR